MNTQAPFSAAVAAGTIIGTAVLGSFAPFLAASAQASAACPYVFTRNLSQGASGADVVKLQQLLNADPATRVASVGPGSPGAETAFFGPATRGAVARFQEKHRAAVLAPVGLSAGTGFVGTATRAQLNGLCSTAPAAPAPATPGAGSPGSPSSPSRGAEASIEKYKVLNSPSNEDVEEDESKKVMAARFDVDDSDATLSRVDVHFKAIGTVKERRPWNMLEEVTLYANGSKVGSVRADRETSWRKNGTDTYSVRFSNLKETLRKGRSHELSVEVTALRRLDSGDVPQDFEVWFPERGIRMRDAAGIDQYAGRSGDPTVFTLERAGLNQELKVRARNNDPESTVFPVKEQSGSSDYTIAVFELEAKDGKATVESLPITVFTYHDGTTQRPFGSVIEDIRLVIDGADYDDYTESAGTIVDVGGASSTATVLTFELEDDPVSLASGERQEVKIVASFRKLSGNYAEGQQLKAGVTEANVDAIEAEGVRTLSAERLTGAADGEIHTLRSEGIILEGLSHSAVRSTASVGPDQGQYSMKVRVSAFAGDFYIPLATGRVDTQGTVVSGQADGGAYFAIEHDAGIASGGMAIASLSSTARRADNAFLIREGQSEEFTLTVAFTPESTAFYQMRLDGLRFRKLGEADSAAQLFEAVPGQRYQTDVAFLAHE